MKIKMIKERETKGAIRYIEINTKGEILDRDKAKIGTLYFRKIAFGNTIPESITVTVEVT